MDDEFDDPNLLDGEAFSEDELPPEQIPLPPPPETIELPSDLQPPPDDGDISEADSEPGADEMPPQLMPKEGIEAILYWAFAMADKKKDDASVPDLQEVLKALGKELGVPPLKIKPLYPMFKGKPTDKQTQTILHAYLKHFMEHVTRAQFDKFVEEGDHDADILHALKNFNLVKYGLDSPDVMLDKPGPKVEKYHGPRTSKDDHPDLRRIVDFVIHTTVFPLDFEKIDTTLSMESVKTMFAKFGLLFPTGSQDKVLG